MLIVVHCRFPSQQTTRFVFWQTTVSDDGTDAIVPKQLSSLSLYYSPGQTSLRGGGRKESKRAQQFIIETCIKNFPYSLTRSNSTFFRKTFPERRFGVRHNRCQRNHLYPSQCGVVFRVMQSLCGKLFAKTIGRWTVHLGADLHHHSRSVNTYHRLDNNEWNTMSTIRRVLLGNAVVFNTRNNVRAKFVGYRGFRCCCGGFEDLT